MNFKKKGWLSEYYQFRLQKPFNTDLPTKSIRLFDKSESGLFEHQLYSFIQPTGLFYGQITVMPFPEKDIALNKYLDKNDKSLFSFIELFFSSLYSNSVLQHNNPNREETNFKRHFEEIIHFTYSYFLAIYKNDRMVETDFNCPELFHIEHYFPLEELLNEALFFDKSLLSFRSYSQNKFIFLDYYFLLKLHTLHITHQNQKIDFIEIKKELTNTKILLLRYMIMAANSSGTIEAQEIKLFKELLLTSRLTQEIRNQLEEEFKSGSSLNPQSLGKLCGFNQAQDWLIKRYFLEMCILVVMSDKIITKDEDKFLHTLTDSLNLSNNDLSQSLVAINTFITINEKELDFINRKYGFFCFSDKLKEAATLAISKNKDRLVTEIHESKELYQLLLKSRNTVLTEEEKFKVKEQLMDIIKSIPTLVALILPGAFITLPILLKLLPKNMFPSAFRE